MKLTNESGAPLFVELDDIALVYQNVDPQSKCTTCIQKRNGTVLMVRESMELVRKIVQQAEIAKYGNPQ